LAQVADGFTSGNSERPLANFARFSTTDVDDARERVARVYCDHRLEPSGRVRKLDAWQNMVGLGSISVGAMGYGADVVIDPGALGEFYLLMLPYSGKASITHGRDAMVSDAQTASVLGPEASTLMGWSADCCKTMVRIDKAALEQQLSRMLGGGPAQHLTFDLAMPQVGAASRWWRTLRLLIEEIEADGDAREGIATNLHETLLLVSLLEHHPNNFSARLACRHGAIAPRHVRNVEAYIEANADRALTLDDLVEVSGVSGRALFEGFRRFRGTSPLAYVRTVRMRKVRDGLMAAEEGQSVTSIATHWGFYQLGRFAAQYKVMFGEAPSETLRRR